MLGIFSLSDFECVQNSRGRNVAEAKVQRLPLDNYSLWHQNDWTIFKHFNFSKFECSCIGANLLASSEGAKTQLGFGLFVWAIETNNEV